MKFVLLYIAFGDTFDFRPLGLAIREARERAGLSRNDLGDKVFYGERHIADIENTGSHPSFQLYHDLVTMFNISVATPFSSYHRRLYFVILTASAYFILPSISGGLVLSFIIFGILILAFRKL
jgi:transcriptional regulator with XRE-family HTH domain